MPKTAAPGSNIRQYQKKAAKLANIDYVDMINNFDRRDNPNANGSSKGQLNPIRNTFKKERQSMPAGSDNSRSLMTPNSNGSRFGQKRMSLGNNA